MGVFIDQDEDLAHFSFWRADGPDAVPGVVLAAEDNAAIVKAIIAMSHQLNLIVVAEGVETKEQLTKLKSMKCDQAQGFFIKRPENAEEITQWIKETYT